MCLREFGSATATFRQLLLLWHTFASRTADSAGQRDILLARTAVEQVAAVGAENERANRRHSVCCSAEAGRR